jgi:hypothetical protein
MDTELVRTCSAADAAVLAGASGRWARVGSTRLRLDLPGSGSPIDANTPARYLVRVELLGPNPATGLEAPDEASRVLSRLFGPYIA